MLVYLLIIALLLLFLWQARQRSWIDPAVLGNWRLWLVTAGQALVLALCAGWQTWKWFGSFPQRYIDLVTGAVGFAAQNKSAEYDGLFAAIAVFVVSLVLIAALYSAAVKIRGSEGGITRSAFYSLLPSAILAGQSLRISDTPGLLILSAALILVFLVALRAALWLGHWKIIDPTNVSGFTGQLVLAILFLSATEAAGAVFFPRIGHRFYHFGMLAGLVIIACAAVLAFGRARLADMRARADLMLALSQVGVPLLFFILASPPVHMEDGSWGFFPYRASLSILLWGLTLVSLLDIWRRFKRRRAEADESPSIVSPWVLVSILVFLQSNPVSWPAISPDEYHAGEFYLPWWLFRQFGALPFAGYEPARGLTNYVPGFLSSLFYDSTFSGQAMVSNIYAAMYVFLAFFALRAVVGDLVAFLSVASISSYSGGPGGGAVVSMACLAILFARPLDRDYIKTFLLWLALAGFASAFAVAEGGIFALATIPVAIWLLWQAYHSSWRNLAILLGSLGLAAILVALIPATRQMMVSAVEYVLRQSGVNDIANGLAWKLPTTSIDARVTSGFLWQIIRFSWLLLLIPLIYRLLKKDEEGLHAMNALLLAALFIMVVLMIPRAAGRIDQDAFSRPGLASIAFVVCGLPLVLLPTFRKGPDRALKVVLIALVFGLIGDQVARLQVAWAQTSYIASQPADLVSGAPYGLANIGRQVSMSNAQLDRQKSLKRVLDRLLRPGETYYDLTNHNSDYGFQGLPSPVADTAFYNAPTEAQQRNDIQAVEAQKVPLALVQAVNIPTDGGTLPLRCFWIYRYMLDHYIPFQDSDGQIWMMRQENVDRLKKHYRAASGQEALNLLSAAFWQKDLAGLPLAWGSSIDSLRSKLGHPVDLLANGQILSVNGVRAAEDGSWQITGQDPYIVIGVPGGAKGDELFIEIDRKLSAGVWQIRWTNDLVRAFDEQNSFVFNSGGARFLVPVSAAPSWELSQGIKQLRIDLPAGFQGMLKFDKIILYDRLPGG